MPPAGNASDLPIFSIIIPARNEEKNLRLLLKDLQAQSIKPHEIICANDASSDDTAEVAKSFGATLINLHEKPKGWTGKTWACQNGANLATGSLLLFLDADVRLGRDGLLRLLQAYQNCQCTISVQPFHTAKEPYEQFSFLFNLIQTAANGTTLPWRTNIGVRGPVILISKADYDNVGGHECVCQHVVEDLALGQKFKEDKIPYQLFVGDKEISYRMYPGGLRSLVQGWVKNFAFGATKTPLLVRIMIVFWIGSITGVPFYLMQAIAQSNPNMIAAYGLLYLLWMAVLGALANKFGRFHALAIIFFPILVIAFFVIFTFSSITRVLGLPVRWKGRVIVGKEKA